MIINKQINSTIEHDYFFYKGKFKDINAKYLIESIEEGCIAKDNRNFATNIIGFMTSFTHLVNGLSHYTKFHNHQGCYFSGVIYLNKHSQVLEFPEINEELKPEKGSFAIFSSFLKHGCSKRNLEEKAKYGISFNCNHVNF